MQSTLLKTSSQPPWHIAGLHSSATQIKELLDRMTALEASLASLGDSQEATLSAEGNSLKNPSPDKSISSERDSLMIQQLTQANETMSARVSTLEAALKTVDATSKDTALQLEKLREVNASVDRQLGHSKDRTDNSFQVGCLHRYFQLRWLYQLYLLL